MKVWITKYALTQGIYEIEAKVCLDTDPSGNMIEQEKTPGSYSQYYHGKGKDWHDNPVSALKTACEMKSKKIATLKKQIVKLEKMKF